MAGGPTAMEIAEFARYLGMDPVEDAALLWIAEEALCSPLPENWEEAVRRDGTPYYYNKKENKSTNKHPLEDFYRSLYKEMKDIQANQEEAAGIADSSAAGGEGGAGAAAGGAIVPSGAKEAGVRRFVTPNEVRDMSTYLGVDPLSEFSLLHIARAAVLAPLPSNWLEFEDEDGNPYYYDRNTLRVTYRHPADEKYFKQVADERARMSSSGARSSRVACLRSNCCCQLGVRLWPVAVAALLTQRWLPCRHVESRAPAAADEGLEAQEGGGAGRGGAILDAVC